MKNRRYSDKNKHFWPFTFCKAHPTWFGVVLNSGAREDNEGDCHITLYLLGFVLICELPKIIKDFRVRHEAKSWDAATVARMGRDWYDIFHAREYGFVFTGEGVLHTYFGPDTDDWEAPKANKNKCFFLPWRNWRHVRYSLYDKTGKHFWTERDGDKTAWEANRAVKQALPKVHFQLEDYDGEIITASTYIDEREWLFGTGWCKGLSLLVSPKVRRNLSIDFSSEVGKEKGSWKGGITGHGISMLPGELHADAFQRYCEQEFRSKEGKFRIRNLGLLPIPDVTATDGMGSASAAKQ
jgi:hypothetical protein